MAGIGHKIKAGFNYVVNYEASLIMAQQKSLHQDQMVFHMGSKQAADDMDCQHHQRILNALKTKYPVFAQYDEFSKQRTHLSGYYREKIDKKMQEAVQNLMVDKKLIAQLNRDAPSIAKHINNVDKYNLSKVLGHEQIKNT